MRYFHRLAAVSALTFSFVSPVLAQGDVAFDFKTKETTTTQGNTTNGETTGRGVMSKGRMRFEMTGNSRAASIPGFSPTGRVTMILPDTGRTFILLDPEKKQYMQVNPAAMMEGLQKMVESMGQTMTMEITGDDPKVENLGAGPDVMGHHTQHWRVTNNTKIKIGVMGQTQLTEASTVSDEYIATDVVNLMDPFRGLQSSPMAGMFGSMAKAYADKLVAARKKLPNGTSLRVDQHVKTNANGREAEVTSTMEVTGIQNITATPDMFAVPADYKQVMMPNMPPRGTE
jgi:hypothetical protein